MAEVISLAERLKQRREELGLSQAQAARELDVARTAYRLWELEAAKPSPDRWRLLSHWLGISVTAMLLAEDLVSGDEAESGGIAEASFGRGGRDWDTVGAANAGDFFEQGRSLILDGLNSGALTSEQGNELTVVLDRLEKERQAMATSGWQTASFRKGLPPDEHAARSARDALSVVAEDIPTEAQETARLLVSELVTNSVTHGPRSTTAVVGLEIEVERGLLRVTVSDTNPERPELKPSSDERGHGLNIVSSLASRWGSDRDGPQNITWFELDLLQPGSRQEPPAREIRREGPR